MSYYIIKKENGEANDFTIVRVPDDLVDHFEMDNQHKILSKGKDLQEVLIAFDKKEDPLELLAPKIPDPELRQMSRSKRR